MSADDDRNMIGLADYTRADLEQHCYNLRCSLQHFARRTQYQEDRRSRLAWQLNEADAEVRRLQRERRERRVSPADPFVRAVAVILTVMLGALLAYAFSLGGIYR